MRQPGWRVPQYEILSAGEKSWIIKQLMFFMAFLALLSEEGRLGVQELAWELAMAEAGPGVWAGSSLRL